MRLAVLAFRHLILCYFEQLTPLAVDSVNSRARHESDRATTTRTIALDLRPAPGIRLPMVAARYAARSSQAKLPKKIEPEKQCPPIGEPRWNYVN